jgi:hypothetical protein
MSEPAVTPRLAHLARTAARALIAEQSASNATRLLTRRT